MQPNTTLHISSQYATVCVSLNIYNTVSATKFKAFSRPIEQEQSVKS
jgi:hypothetical protein